MRVVLALCVLTGGPCIASAEDYRLVHAVDDKETTIRKGLTEEECRRLRADFLSSETIVVQASEESAGALTCLPERKS